MTPKEAAQRAISMTLTFDIAMAGLAMSAAHLVSYLGRPHESGFDVHSWLLATSAFMLTAAAALVLGGIHRHIWRHIGAPDANRLMQVIGLTVLFYLPVMVVLNGAVEALVPPVPTLLMATIVWAAALFGARMAARWRTTQHPMHIFQKVAQHGQPLLLLGDQNSWVDVLRRIEGGGPRKAVRVLGLIELYARESGRAVRGVPVLGSLRDLGDVIDLLKLRCGEVPWVALTGPARTQAIMLQVLETTSKHGAEIMALGPDEASQTLEPLCPADLLARPLRQLDMEPIRQLVTGARVLITGGGGLIGAELARQVAAEGPAELIIIDASEYNLYRIELDLQQSSPGLALTCLLGDVRDADRMAGIFANARPEIVLHAAALKNVPLMERHVCEAVLTNVSGADIIARAAARVGARRFVFISTDKAVRPDNVMAATKRLAELVIGRIVRESGMAGAMVRFGNVLGSSGSVVPLFERQIAQGGPVTITDPEATRFFMTIEEASSLVLQAAALQDQSAEAGLFVLDMGEPIAIRQLAETMIRLKGKVPYADIEICTMGLREGEKLHEALTYPHEALAPTTVMGVRSVTCEPPSSEVFSKQIAQLTEVARRHDTGETLRLLAILVPEYGEERAYRKPVRQAEGV